MYIFMLILFNSCCFFCCILTGVHFEKIPEEKTVYSGDKVDLSIYIFSQEPVTFTCQWNFSREVGDPVFEVSQGIAADDPDYEGSQTSTLIINKCLPKHQGYYVCVVNSNPVISCGIHLTLNHGMLSRIVY